MQSTVNRAMVYEHFNIYWTSGLFKFIERPDDVVSQQILGRTIQWNVNMVDSIRVSIEQGDGSGSMIAVQMG
jgi:hypothetical protein